MQNANKHWTHRHGSTFWLPQKQNSCCTEPFYISCTGTALCVRELEYYFITEEFYEGFVKAACASFTKFTVFIIM